MKIEALLNGILAQQIGESKGIDIKAIQFDSRLVTTNTLFVAIKGVQTDGHDYINKAIDQGATAILCEQIVEPKENVFYIVVEDAALAMGIMARNFYGDPSANLQLVGITGTNGKTTTATLLYQLFMKLGYTVGLISTVENKIGEKIIPSTHTTPDVLALNRLLVQMNEAGCEYAFMEVSSHAIEQQRIAGVHFVGGVFTNITHDHLDYHKTFQNYIYAKKKFFDQLPTTAFALTNIDDKRGAVMLQNTLATKVTYALKSMATYKAKVIENSLSGLIMDLDGEEFYTRLVGGFNAYNLLCVYATARLLEADKLEVMAALSVLDSAEGRFDFWQDATTGVVSIVDYAHTPDALEKVLQTIDKLRTGTEKIITVVGCGGDRDTNKRPMMAKVACDYSQQVILTSDNPRTEVPSVILEQMEVGVPQYAKRYTLIIEDRRQAIRTACQLATNGDIILVAGKGHEKYQDVKGVKLPFDDKEELRKALEE